MGKTKQIKKENLEKFQLQPLSNAELANIYGISRTTLLTWMKPFKNELGERKGWYYNIRQVKIIIEHLGFPDTIEEL